MPRLILDSVVKYLDFFTELSNLNLNWFVKISARALQSNVLLLSLRVFERKLQLIRAWSFELFMKVQVITQ